MTFFDRYNECCKKIGIAPCGQAAADRIGCNKSTISLLSKNKNTPRGDLVAGAAKMLDVSADYLLGLIEKPHPIETDDSLSFQEMQLINMFRDLNNDGQQAAMSMLAGLLANDIYKTNNSVGFAAKEA